MTHAGPRSRSRGECRTCAYAFSVAIGAFEYFAAATFKPVQYVKICSLYGAGFYYMPGTDTCIKVGGFVRAEVNFGAGGSFTPSFQNWDEHGAIIKA